jgi:3-dehydroquinate dehydratase-2
MKKILVLHGPNLHRLGLREPDIYGSTTLEALNAQLFEQARDAGCTLRSFQSNSESDIIDAIYQAADEQIQYILINPAAFTHTSIALRDAFLAVKVPFYEVHISNIFAREPFRHHSYLSDIAEGLICGFGMMGYSLALDAIIRKL